MFLPNWKDVENLNDSLTADLKTRALQFMFYCQMFKGSSLNKIHNTLASKHTLSSTSYFQLASQNKEGMGNIWLQMQSLEEIKILVVWVSFKTPIFPKLLKLNNMEKFSLSRGKIAAIPPCDWVLHHSVLQQY